MKKRFANGVNEGINEYYQKRIEEEYFKGYVCLVKIKNVKEPKIVNDDDYTACILDENYEWLEIYPDNKKYAITVMFDDKKNLIEWYFDIIKTSGIENEIPYIEDLYLDLVIRPNGKEIVLDEDELEEALNKKDITKEDFDMAYRTMKEIKDKYVNNLEQLIELTDKLYNRFSSSLFKEDFIIEIKFDKNNNKSIAYDNNIQIGKCEFIELDECWNIIHTEVSNLYQGQGIARRLVESIIENAKKCNKNIIAECSYAKKVMEVMKKKE